MARPKRQGIDYFPLDVYMDDKFKFIEIKYGLEGFAVVIKLFQRIYSQGYWCNWGEDEQLMFAYENNLDHNTLQNIVNECFNREVFSKELYTVSRILTSTGIQKRYFEIVKRRKEIEIVKEYLLDVDISGLNVCINPPDCLHDVDTMHTRCIHDACKSTQSKGKVKVKGKYSKERVKDKESVRGKGLERVSEVFEVEQEDSDKKIQEKEIVRSNQTMEQELFDLLTDEQKEQELQRQELEREKEEAEKKELAKQKRLVNDKRFEEFWKLYPRKSAKKPSRDKWHTISPDDDTFMKIIRAVKLQKQTKQWKQNKGQFIPLPSTWLNQERWNDDLGTKNSDVDKKDYEKDYEDGDLHLFFK